MIIYFPFLAFALGLLFSYGSAGVRRQTGTLLMVAAAAWALAFLATPTTAWWGIGPVVATLMLRRPAERVPSSFETLTGRTLTVAGLMLTALFVASRLRIGENPLLVTAVPWLLLALGAAWVVRPIDARERLQGQVLLVAGVGAILLAASPAGPITALLAGAMAAVPIAGERVRVPPTWRPLLSPLGLGLAAAAALLAATRLSIPRPTVSDLSFDFAGSALLAVAIVLVAGVLHSPLGHEWAALLAVMALLTTAPSVRWPAIAALIAVATLRDRAGERIAWLAVGALALVPVLQALAPAALSPRLQTVALAIGLLLMVGAARAGLLRVVALPATVFLVLLSVGSLTSANLTRFQWLAASGGALLIFLALISKLRADDPPPVARDQLIVGMLFLAISARDALGLGVLALALLLIDLAIVRWEDVPFAGRSLAGRLLTLARSNWPPSVTFAGATLAVIAALQASLALGLLAALILAALQLAPLLDRHALVTAPPRPRSMLHWLAPALSIACGIAPAVVLRMLRL